MPEISVIIPVYNTEKYVEECVNSVREQTLSDIEIILVDDGSTDGSADILTRLAAQDNRIRVFGKKNGGAGLARNTGLKNAVGDYIAFVDSDDIIDKNMLETLVNVAKENNADMAMTGIRHMGGIVFGGKDAVKFDFKEKEIFCGDGGMERLVLGTVGALADEAEDSRYGYSACKNIYRKSVIDQNNLRFCSEREFASEDMLFLIDFIFCAKCAVGVPGAMYQYRRNECSTSKSYKEGRFKRCREQIAEVKRRLSERIEPQIFTPYCNRQLQAYARFALSQEIMRPCKDAAARCEQAKNIKEVLNDVSLRTALKGLWWLKLPKMQAVFALCMKLRLGLALRILVKMREKI